MPIIGDEKADKEMEEYLASLNQTTPANNQNAPTHQDKDDDEVDESAFYADDDDAEDETTNPHEVGGDVDNATQPPAKTESTITQRDLEYERQLAEERAKNKLLIEQMQMVNQNAAKHQEQEPPEDPLAEFNVEFTPDELTQYDPAAIELARKAAKTVVKDLFVKHIAPLQERIKQQDSQLTQYANNAGHHVVTTFYNNLVREEPDIDKDTKSPQWVEFLQKPVPFTGGAITYQKLYQAHIQNLNGEGIKEIYRAFKQQGNKGPATNEIVPGKSNTSIPPSALNGRRERKLAYSKYIEASQKFRQGTMSYDAYRKIEELYQDAELNDRIDYNK